MMPRKPTVPPPEDNDVAYLMNEFEALRADLRQYIYTVIYFIPRIFKQEVKKATNQVQEDLQETI